MSYPYHHQQEGNSSQRPQLQRQSQSSSHHQHHLNERMMSSRRPSQPAQSQQMYNPLEQVESQQQQQREQWRNGIDVVGDNQQEETHICNYCGLKWATRRQLLNHKKTVHNLSFECALCKTPPGAAVNAFQFKTKGELDAHFILYHREINRAERKRYFIERERIEISQASEFAVASTIQPIIMEQNWGHAVPTTMPTGGRQRQRVNVSAFAYVHNQTCDGIGIGVPVNAGGIGNRAGPGPHHHHNPNVANLEYSLQMSRSGAAGIPLDSIADLEEQLKQTITELGKRRMSIQTKQKTQDDLRILLEQRKVETAREVQMAEEVAQQRQRQHQVLQDLDSRIAKMRKYVTIAEEIVHLSQEEKEQFYQNRITQNEEKRRSLEKKLKKAEEDVQFAKEEKRKTEQRVIATEERLSRRRNELEKAKSELEKFKANQQKTTTNRVFGNHFNDFNSHRGRGGGFNNKRSSSYGQSHHQSQQQSSNYQQQQQQRSSRSTNNDVFSNSQQFSSSGSSCSIPKQFRFSN